MPSKYEPCGLTQMECQRYGTVPIVRATGGLLDTVSEQSIPDFPSPNGFRFQGLTEDMRRAVERAIAAFRNHNQRRELIGNALRQDNGWDSRVLAYERLYSGLELQGDS
jgi:starch synthase